MRAIRIPAFVLLAASLALDLPLRAAATAPSAPEGSPGLAVERENNDVAARATPFIGTSVVGWGNIYPAGDVDYFAFQASAGDRVYAATMTSGSSSLVVDTNLSVIGTDGVSVLEIDDNDGSLSGPASSIAGRTLPSAGTYFIRVMAPGVTVRPYFLHLRVQPAAVTPEIEPNNNIPTAISLPAGGHVTGAHLTSDQDWFKVDLNAGDTLFASLDADPERDLVTWNARLAVGRFGDAGNQLLTVDDPNATSPNSEAVFVTVQQAGTYYVRVDSATSTGAATHTYDLSVSVHPATAASPVCTTYTSTDVPVSVPDGGGPAHSTIEVPGHPRILDLDVSLQLTHPLMNDLDFVLGGPAGNDVGLFTDIGATTTNGQTQMDLRLDDEAATPLSAFTVLKGIVAQPDPSFRLAWFDGLDGGGIWTLRMWDDNSNGNFGALNGWSITICEPPAPDVCLGTTVSVYASDFEAGDGGFTHSGNPDEWQRGLPSGDSAPILGCNSGTHCWKTNLTGVYSDNALMKLYSPPVSLLGLAAPIEARWAQVSQMENASFDAMDVAVHDFATLGDEKLYAWLDGTQDDNVGPLNVDYIPMISGWSERSANLNAHAGSNIRLTFSLTSDDFLGYSGLGIDDVSVTACCTAASCSDGDPCTSDFCDAALGCVHTSLEGQECDDGNPCTVGDTCTAKACSGSAPPPATEVNDSLRLGKTGLNAVITWTDEPGPYNVYRGVRGGGGFTYNHACLSAGIQTPPASDSLSGPPASLYYYLVSRKGCSESAPGRNSEGVPTPTANPCP